MIGLVILDLYWGQFLVTLISSGIVSCSSTLDWLIDPEFDYGGNTGPMK
jgi:hypothetical protein